jgi:hypothetical protein
MRYTITAMALAGLAGTAAAQVTVVSATALARATAGDGSGVSQQSSNSLSGASVSASRNFQNGGHVDASASWGLSNWVLSGSFGGHSFAQSQFEAGSSEVQTLVNFDAAHDLDLEYSGGYSINSPGGNIDMAVRNRVTNAYVVGGNFPNLVHVNAGQYKLELNAFLPYGDMSGGYNIEFHPGNDRCQFARVVGNGVYQDSTAYATFDGSATCGSSNTSKSVWYKYTATATAPLTISTCGSAFDTVLSVYDTDTCPSGTGTQIACNDDAPSGQGCGLRQSLVTINAVSGNTYYIRISGYNGASGEYTLNIGPTNDECENAMDIGPGTYDFDNRLANTDGPVLNQCTNGGADNQVHGDLWYRFTPAFSGQMFLDTCGSSFDTKMAVYINAPCAGRSTYVACNDDGCSLQSKLEFIPVTEGFHYYIRVGGYQTNRGTGELHLNILPNPPCRADFNGDGFLDFFDYDDYVNCFETATCPPGKTADFNGDGFADFFDYDDFVAAFEAGC